MSFLVGQAMLTEATALELKSEGDEADPLWIAAVVLMILGAIYAGKLAVMSAKCCLRRLQWFKELPAAVANDGDASSSSATKNDDVRSSSMQRSGTSNAARPLSSSSPEQAVVAGPVQAVSSDGPGQATRSPCRSAAAVASSSGAESGPVQASTAAVASSSGAESGPGQASTTAAAAPSSDAGSGPEQPLLLTYLALSRPCTLWRRFPGELLRMVLALSRLCGSMQLE